MITGALVWTPLGLAALQRSRAALPAHVWWPGIAAGLIASVAVLGLAYAKSRKPVN